MKNIVGCCNFTEAKSREVHVYSFTGQGVVSQKPNDTSKKTLCLALEVKTVNLDCHLLLSVARLVRFWLKSLQNLTTHNKQFLQGNLFLLAVYMHDVALYLCSIFCSRSLVEFNTVSYHVFECGTRPNLYPVTLTTTTCETMLSFGHGTAFF